MVYEQRLFSIREVSEITGVKPVTLRAWQRRYNLIQPQRTDKGHRLFADQDINRIQEIQGWLNKGISIGKVAGFLDHPDGDEELSAAMKQTNLDEFDDMLDALTQLKHTKLSQLINSVLKEYPLDIVIERLIFPVMDALEKMKNSVKSLSKALLQSILLSKLALIIDSENRAANKGRCLFISFDPVGSLYAWLKAAQVTESGYHLTILDGVEDVAGLTAQAVTEPYKKVVLFSNKALNEAQLNNLQLLQNSFRGEIEYSDVIETLHALESNV